MAPNRRTDRHVTRVADDPGPAIEVAKAKKKDRHRQKIDGARSVVVRAKSGAARARRSAAHARKGARVGRGNPENLVQGMSRTKPYHFVLF